MGLSLEDISQYDFIFRTSSSEPTTEIFDQADKAVISEAWDTEAFTDYGADVFDTIEDSIIAALSQIEQTPEYNINDIYQDVAIFAFWDLGDFLHIA